MKASVKKSVCTLFFLAAALSCFSLEVNQGELESAGDDSIQFENFGGPYLVIESADAITNIGTELGLAVAEDVLTPITVHPEGKYTLVHAIDSENKSKLSADILILNADAGVDHIKNLRRITTGFLSAAYGYSKEDAETLSVFITIYNAVYRNQIEQFSQKYNDQVLELLSKENVGLSTNWEDWAGHTQIVIPLGYVETGISSVDTTTISDEKVVEALQKEDDAGIEVREQLTEIKERESETASENAKQAQKEAAEQRKEGNTEEAKESAARATEQQNLADKKREEVKSDKAQIAKDAEKKAEEVIPEVQKLTGLFMDNAKKNLMRLITVNAETGELLKKSPVNSVRSRAVYLVDNITLQDENGNAVQFKEMYLAVCGMNNKKSAVRLCLLDTENLELRKQSAEILSEDAELVLYEGNFIAIIQDGKKYYAGLYDKNLNLKAKSSVAVDAATPVNSTPQGLLVTGADGKPVLLNPADLSIKWSNVKTHVMKTSNEK